jgi:hypothetical protein
MPGSLRDHRLPSRSARGKPPGPWASLELDQNGTVGGNVLVNYEASFDENDSWTVNGTIVGNSAAELVIAATTHNILANNDGTLAIQSAMVKGNIVSNNGIFGGAIVSSVIYGNVLVNGTSPGEDGVTSTWLIAGPQLNSDDQAAGVAGVAGVAVKP